MCIVLVLVFCTVYSDVEMVGKFSSLIILIADALCTWLDFMKWGSVRPGCVVGVAWAEFSMYGRKWMWK